MEDEVAIQTLDREIPAGQISDENRTARKRSISHHKAARQSSLIVFQPEFQFQIIYYLDKEEMVAADPIDCRRPNFTTRRDAGCHRFCRIVAQQVGEREIGSGTLFEKIERLVDASCHRKAYVLLLLRSVEDEGCPVEENFDRAVVAGYAD